VLVWPLQPGQGFAQFRIVDLAILTGGLNLLEHLPDGIDHAQQRGGDLRIQGELAVA